MNDLALATAFGSLGYEEQVDVLANALVGNPLFVDVVRSSSMNGLGDEQAAPDTVSASVMALLEPLMPALGAKLQEVAEPATQKAMEVILPKIKEQIPLFAALTGIFAGLLVVAGIYLSKKL